MASIRLSFKEIEACNGALPNGTAVWRLPPARGIWFLDAKGHAFISTGATLCGIERIDPSGMLPEAKRAEFAALRDEDNPLCGPNGAVHVFSPQ